MTESGPTKPSQPHEYVSLMNARNLTEAEFFKGLLVSRDIPAIIGDEAGESIGFPSSIFGDGVPVLVPDQMLEEAKKALQSAKQAEPKE